MTKRTKQGKKVNDEMLARIEKLYDDFTPEDGVLMMMYFDKDQVHTYNIGNFTSCAATIATAVDNGYDLKNVGDSDATFTGRAIVEGINAVIARRGITGLRVAMKILKALRDAGLEKGKSKESSGDDFLSVLTDIAIKAAEKKDVDVRDEDDDEEDCEHCKANKICPLPQAIAYRKANHIPNPNRKVKRGKKIVYEPQSMCIDKGLEEGVWVVVKHMYGKSYSTGRYLNDCFMLLKACDIQETPLSKLGGMDKLADWLSCNFDKLPKNTSQYDFCRAIVGLLFQYENKDDGNK